MFSTPYLLIIAAVLVITAGQVLFKYAAMHVRTGAYQTYAELISNNTHPIGVVLIACMLYALSTVAWVQALRTVPLSVAFMFNSLAFALVPLAGIFLFNEHLPRYFLPGLLMILGGLFMVSRG
jgi:drug/metabolite transporter (DMT)-like permease